MNADQHPLKSSRHVSVRRHVMSRLIGVSLLLGTAALAGCATNSPARHEYIMRGQVLSVDGSTLTVCVGTLDGAKVGQLLDVIRHVRRTHSPKASGSDFRREDVGQVRIASLFDEHYATAEIVKGHPEVNDTVELEH
jgi:hypothetical protein